MNQLASKLHERAERKSRKRDEKKKQIARSAIKALQQLGYANTGLRDIAADADMSLGSLHYYFEDKTELIIYCVTRYKEDFVHDIAEKLQLANDVGSLIDGFALALADTIIDDSETHQLWYDIRSQSQFDPTFRPVVLEIEASMLALVETAATGMKLNIDHVTEYAALDGIFRYLLQERRFGEEKSRDELREVFRRYLQRWKN